MIETSGRGKDVIDRINTCDKRYLIEKQCMIGTPEKDDNESRIYTYSIVGKWSFILAVKYKRLCENKERINSVKGYNFF